ncbi:tryptophan-rich sensory protein [Oceaniferula spumae]|uniref:Tryptophan-rich sensory protein n=1 Tax=Oceaniferula spumae TaxID=2979115 RepID=A0AAT9FMK8_9BACT
MAHRSLKSQIIGLVGWFMAAFTAAGLGAIATSSAGEFYGSLTHPAWAPPAWLFGPVWSLLYGMMAVAAWLVWRRHGFQNASKALWIFGVQLIVNALWSWLFFRWHLGALAFAEIVLLWLLIVVNIVAFWRLHKVSALLLLPYLAWVSFATALAFTMWRLNPELLG